MELDTLVKASNVLRRIQNWYTPYIAEEIYGKELGKHLFAEWLECDGNILNYLSLLDEGNKDILLTWGDQY